MCNGAFLDGNYVYLSTTTFPYILGCFGPAAVTQSYTVSCSTASCPTDDGDTGAVTLSTFSSTLLGTVLGLTLIAF